MIAAADPYFDHWMRNRVWEHLVTRTEQIARARAVVPLFAGHGEVLDVACATGELTERIRAAHAPRRIVGCDGSPRMVAEASRRWPGIEFVRAEAEALPFADGSFDAVHCGELLEHLADPAALVERLAAIARRTVVLTTPNIVIGDPQHVSVWTPAAVRELLAPRFAEVEVSPIGEWFVLAIGRHHGGTA